MNTALRLSAQRALLGRIGPTIRLIKVRFDEDVIVLEAVVSKEPDDRVREDISIAAAEIIADFPDAKRVDEVFRVSWDMLPADDVIVEGWVYQRVE